MGREGFFIVEGVCHVIGHVIRCHVGGPDRVLYYGRSGGGSEGQMVEPFFYCSLNGGHVGHWTRLDGHRGPTGWGPVSCQVSEWSLCFLWENEWCRLNPEEEILFRQQRPVGGIFLVWKLNIKSFNFIFFIKLISRSGMHEKFLGEWIHRIICNFTNM